MKMNTKPSILVAIADDHLLMRKGTVGIINSFPDFEVIIEAENGKDLLEQIEKKETKPHVAVIDISMPEMNGYDTAIELKRLWPQIQILALSMIKEEFSIMRMLRNGAKGYVLKASHPEDLHKALIEVYNDNYYSSEVLSSSRLLRAIGGRDELSPKITDREMRVLGYYCQGMENKEISSEMKVSIRTVEGYRNSLFEKLDVHSKVELVIFALRTGLVSLD